LLYGSVDKIFDLTQVGLNSDSSQIATDDDDNNVGLHDVWFLGVYIHFSIYGLFTWGPILHTPASEHGSDVDNDEYYLGLDIYCSSDPHRYCFTLCF
jgi:hypothetical protein